MGSVDTQVKYGCHPERSERSHTTSPDESVPPHLPKQHKVLTACYRRPQDDIDLI
jgi:hypothetical protein